MPLKQQPEPLPPIEETDLDPPSPSKTTLPAVHGDSVKEDRRVHLLVLAGNNVGQLCTLNLGMTLLGRDDDCNIQIMDAGISRHHAMVYFDSRRLRYELRDLGSRNGTFVNDEPLGESRVLERGDKIRLGVNTVLRVSYGDELETQYARDMYEAMLRDGLTGAFNRRYFDNRLASELAFAQRHQTALSVVLFDIDHFKQVNDTHGHPAGDAVLRQLATRVFQAIRAEDVLARYGGEEFGVVGRDIDEDHALLLGERLRLLVSSTPFRLASVDLPVTISLGVAELGKSGAQDAAQLVKAADEALYRAKASGRNRTVRASELLS
jgi:two-component system cell cycle response regulator